MTSIVLKLLFVAALFAAWYSDRNADVFLAYIGPGAGFAFLGSFLSILVSFALTLCSLIFWPFRIIVRLARRRLGFRKAKIRRLIFLGLDGLDPRLTERYIAEGKMPNLARLREHGSYSRLRTTFPSLSPVAWSTFATGVAPAKHNIFDFLNRSLKTYVPELSSCAVRPPRRFLKLGRIRIPLSRPVVDMRRKSRTFWSILGEQDISSTILRVPITFPPEPFNGRLLSAMCTPDLSGTQGSFLQFTTSLEQPSFDSGSRYPLQPVPGGFAGIIEGPENSLVEGAGALRMPFLLLRSPGSATVTLELPDGRHTLKEGEYSLWIRLTFRAAPGATVYGIARFRITETEPNLTMYVTPIQIDPETPALPISHPGCYAAYLAKLLGSFATLGMAEDTWALNEGVLDEAAFLEQAYSILEERESMFRHALEQSRRGVVACVFDTSDRVQHMFFRHLDAAGDARWQHVIEDLYRRMDRVVGDAMRNTGPDTVLFVLSDHGFCSFRRAVNVNSWLLQNGYLALEDGAVESGCYFHDVDWRRTRAYCLGLSGLYLNVKGRESCGTVAPGAEAEELKRELIERLSGLQDDEFGCTAIRSVYDTNKLYRGPYLDAAPDLIVGYEEGYRVSWEGAVGQITARVIEDNPKPWSGDHCVDPHLVPGVLFCNRKIDSADPGIEDMAPTALSLFGIQPPAWMDGKPVLRCA